MSVKVTMDGDTLVIRATVAKPPKLSSSGKTLLLVTTHGSLKTGVERDGKEIVLGLNAWIPR